MNKLKTYNSFSTNESNDDKIRTSIKTALENMYMFGGMPKPDPKYDSYMNKMIEYVMKSIKEEYGK